MHFKSFTECPDLVSTLLVLGTEGNLGANAVNGIYLEFVVLIQRVTRGMRPVSLCGYAKDSQT